MKYIHSSMFFLGIISSHFSFSNPLDCDCLKDVVYGEREYSSNNSNGDGVSQSEFLSQLINAGTFIHNQGNKWFGDGSQSSYLKVIHNDYASTFSFNDVLSCIGSNIDNEKQMKLALENINEMRITSYGIPIFDVTSMTLLSTGIGNAISGGISTSAKKWTEIGTFTVGLLYSAYNGYQNVGDVFAYLAIKESDYCRKKHLQKFVVLGDIEKY